MSSIVIGLVIGYITAWALGMVDFSAVQSYGGFNIPVPFRYGISFDISSIIALALVYLITAIEAYGDITANSLISGEPVEGETFVKRASGGILADGFNSMLAGFFNSFPNSIFGQPLCRLLHCRLPDCSRLVPSCRTCIFADARACAWWSYFVDVRYSSCSWYPYHCCTED